LVTTCSIVRPFKSSNALAEAALRLSAWESAGTSSVDALLLFEVEPKAFAEPSSFALFVSLDEPPKRLPEPEELLSVFELLPPKRPPEVEDEDEEEEVENAFVEAPPKLTPSSFFAFVDPPNRPPVPDEAPLSEVVVLPPKRPPPEDPEAAEESAGLFSSVEDFPKRPEVLVLVPLAPPNENPVDDDDPAFSAGCSVAGADPPPNENPVDDDDPAFSAGCSVAGADPPPNENPVDDDDPAFSAGCSVAGADPPPNENPVDDEDPAFSAAGAEPPPNRLPVAPDPEDPEVVFDELLAPKENAEVEPAGLASPDLDSEAPPKLKLDPDGVLPKLLL